MFWSFGPDLYHVFKLLYTILTSYAVIIIRKCPVLRAGFTSTHSIQVMCVLWCPIIFEPGVCACPRNHQRQVADVSLPWTMNVAHIRKKSTMRATRWRPPHHHQAGVPQGCGTGLTPSQQEFQPKRWNVLTNKIYSKSIYPYFGHVYRHLRPPATTVNSVALIFFSGRPRDDKRRDRRDDVTDDNVRCVRKREWERCLV